MAGDLDAVDRGAGAALEVDDDVPAGLLDDLGMHAALIAGDVTVRTQLCLEAGCDLVLVCQPSDVAELLDGFSEPFADASDHIASMYGTERLSHDEMLAAESPSL